MNNPPKTPIPVLNRACSEVFDNLITIAEFCRLTKFSPRTVYNWIHREADFPYIKWGRSIRLEFPKVISWLEARS